MKLPNLNSYSRALTLAFLLVNAAGCVSAQEKIRPENQKSDSATVSRETNVGGDDAKSSPRAEKPVSTTAPDVAGRYECHTERNGEGCDNNKLEIKRVGGSGNKLSVFISGAYSYLVGETRTFAKSEGKGDAVLKGNVARATLVDEADESCRATITFKANTADVKISDACQFNIALSGVYKKVSTKTESKKEIETPDVREISYKTMDFVNDFDARKVGEEFVVTDVPSEILDQKNRADEFGNASYRGLYYLQGVTDDDTPSYSVSTSKAMIESLKKEAGYEPVILRMTAVITESKGKFDVSRLPFVTKIEAFNSDGDVIWTATGGKPAKLNFTH